MPSQNFPAKPTADQDIRHVLQVVVALRATDAFSVNQAACFTDYTRFQRHQRFTPPFTVPVGNLKSTPKFPFNEKMKQPHPLFDCFLVERAPGTTFASR
ncbi:hypothetical protein Aduo_011211 [Ancylostoma duodenale]